MLFSLSPPPYLSVWWVFRNALWYVLVFSQELVRDEAPNERREGGEEREGVVDDGGYVLVVTQLVLQVDGQQA